MDQKNRGYCCAFLALAFFFFVQPAFAWQPIEPIGECVEENQDGTFTGQFGYDAGESANIAVGRSNFVSPDPEDRGQPTSFTKGVTSNAFRTTFAADEVLTWTVSNHAPGNEDERLRNLRSDSLSKYSPRCDTPEEPVRPKADCLKVQPDGSYLVYYGYTNYNSYAVEIPVPEELYRNGIYLLTPQGNFVLDKGQPEIFEPGTHEKVFSVEWNGDDNLYWIIQYPEDTGDRLDAQANKKLPECEVVPERKKISPVLECVEYDFHRQIYEAYWGYNNPNDEEVEIPVGQNNKFTPAPQDRSQPTTFESGRKVSVFSTGFTADNLVWTLDGKTATASKNSKRCSDEPPVCTAGGDYAQSCEGIQTSVPLDGSGSYDPEGGPLTYQWTTNCPDSSLENADESMPTLLLNDPANDYNCQVFLVVTDFDGNQSECQAPVQVEACEFDCLNQPNGNAVIDICGVCDGDGTSCLDCEGTPFGNAVVDECGVCGGSGPDICGICGGDGTSCLDCEDVPFGNAIVDECGICGGPGPDECGTCDGSIVTDRCGVCGGDGSSCLECVETNQSAKYDAIRDNLQRQLRLIAKELRAARRLPLNLRKRGWQIARAQYQEALQALEELPASVLDCNNTEFCIRVDVAGENLEKVTDKSKRLARIYEIILRRVGRTYEGGECEGTVAECRARAKRRVRERAQKIRSMDDFFVTNGGLASTVNRFQSSCS